MDNFKLQMQIADIILEIANQFNDVDYSDLSGMADLKAQKIIEMVREVYS